MFKGLHEGRGAAGSKASALRRRSAQRIGTAVTMAVAMALTCSLPVRAANDAYSPNGAGGYDAGGAANDAYRPDELKQAPETYEPVRPVDQSPRSGGYDSGRASDPGGVGEPYSPGPSGDGRAEHYEPVPPADNGGPPEQSGRYYSQSEIVKAGHGFFGTVSKGMAEAVEWAFQKAGRPNGYILGEDAGGALIAGLRYGEGTLHTKDAGQHKVYWQGPSVGYDLGAEGSKVMVLVYNMRDPSDIYNRFGGVQGAAYLVGGVGVQLQKSGEVTLAPIRSGLGVRLGANVGYLKYTRNPTWNPF